MATELTCITCLGVATPPLRIADTAAEVNMAKSWFGRCAGSLPRLLERLVGAKVQQGEEYRLLLKLLQHASHLQVQFGHPKPTATGS